VVERCCGDGEIEALVPDLLKQAAPLTSNRHVDHKNAVLIGA